MKPLVDDRLSDPVAERRLASHAAAIREIQDLPASSIRVIKNVDLSPSVETPIPHRLGRAPLIVLVSAIRTPFGGIANGVFIEYRGTFPTGGAAIDPTKIVVLAAFNFGATVRVDVLVM